MDRRDFLRATTAAILSVPGRAPSAPAGSPQDLADIAAAMTDGRLTARGLTQIYLDRIEALDRHGPQLRAVLETIRVRWRSPPHWTRSAARTGRAGHCTACRF